MIKLEYLKLREDAKKPTRGSEYAAGYDLYVPLSSEDIIIKPHTTEKIGIGIAIALPENTYGGIFARSGLSTKQGLRPSNCVGVCDCDYRGEIIVAMHNDTNEERVIKAGERIAQLVIMPYIQVDFVESEYLNETQRGDSGFGSTGI